MPASLQAFSVLVYYLSIHTMVHCSSYSYQRLIPPRSSWVNGRVDIEVGHQKEGKRKEGKITKRKKDDADGDADYIQCPV